jgi:predicted metal-binding membrane protein
MLLGLSGRLTRNLLEYFLWGAVAISWFMLLTLGHPHSPNLFQAFAQWEWMIVAMMMPSVIPMAASFNLLIQGHKDLVILKALFLLAYLTVWTLFATGMVCLQVGFTHLFSSNELHAYFPIQIQSLSLVLMGAYQFSPTKQNCLQGCQSVATFIAHHYQEGLMGAWNLGIQHGIFCLGCCWVIMVGLCSLGMENLMLMLLFTAIMTVERLWRRGVLFSKLVGVCLLVAGALSGFNRVIVHIPLHEVAPGAAQFLERTLQIVEHQHL